MAEVNQMLWLILIPEILYALLLLFLIRRLYSIPVFIPEKQAVTKVTIVVPCRNEEGSLPYLLSDIISQSFPDTLTEVIIVDDGSADNTTAVALSYHQLKNLRVLKSKGQGKKSALKTGIEAAGNSLIVTTDADCRFDSRWLETIVAYFEKSDADLIIGPVAIKSKEGFFHRFQELEFLGLQAITAATAEAGSPIMCNGANLAFRKESWLKHHQYLKEEIPSGDDIFFLHSLKSEKGSVISWLDSADAVVRTKPSESPASFIDQRARWLSKSPSYDDLDTKIIALITLFAAIELPVLLIAGMFNPMFFRYLLAAFLIKSIADLLILAEISRHRGRYGLLKWFLPSQFVYPFYVLAVTVHSIFRKKAW